MTLIQALCPCNGGATLTLFRERLPGQKVCPTEVKIEPSGVCREELSRYISCRSAAVRWAVQWQMHQIKAGPNMPSLYNDWEKRYELPRCQACGFTYVLLYFVVPPAIG